jgi:hypothetical protein
MGQTFRRLGSVSIEATSGDDLFTFLQKKGVDKSKVEKFRLKSDSVILYIKEEHFSHVSFLLIGSYWKGRPVSVEKN